MKSGIINTLENIGVSIVTLLVLNFVIVKPMRNDIKEIYTILAEKPTYSIQNEFDKMRTKKGGNINLDLQNEMNQFEAIQDSTATNEKGFLKRVFRKRK